ncbi:MAG: hypothetical protein ACOX3E_02980 [Desulfomonilia bacterium]|jgi:hypothetical protein|nr:hypothetical protein [Pseudomonadota bacterium]HON38940.1 hypothetical protein [Deltaproteobacteria bacterium]HRR69207.1 hypothetical protein [Desulfomonilia bacterium]HPD22510.1 hypothetical protein [Deltaproteobacteria bacterium]HPX17527.1 hypothetical protein [Deltaproteobacteria bacterium]
MDHIVKSKRDKLFMFDLVPVFCDTDSGKAMQWNDNDLRLSADNLSLTGKKDWKAKEKIS